MADRVWVLTEEPPDDNSELLGVFASEQLALEAEPDARWEDHGDGEWFADLGGSLGYLMVRVREVQGG